MAIIGRWRVISVADHEHLLQVLEQLQKEFLAQLPERLQEIEERIRGLDVEALSPDDLAAIYRDMHNLKGVAGTHNLKIISRISHHIEDHLTNAGKEHFPSALLVDMLLPYLALIREAMELAGKGSINFDPVETALEKLNKQTRQRLVQKPLEILVVEPTTIVLKILESQKYSTPVHFHYRVDGLAALELLSLRPFDLLIIGQELLFYTGYSVLSALKNSENINKDLTSILVTSDEGFDSVHSPVADQVIIRNGRLIPLLYDAIERQSGSDAALAS